MPFKITFDYSLDGSGFFNNQAAREALEEAAAIWENLIGDDFEEVSSGVEFTVTDPSDQSGRVAVVLNQPVDDIIIFVGADDLGGWRSTTNGQTITGGRAGTEGWDAAGDILRSRIYDTFRGSAISDFEPWAGSISFNSNTDADFSFDLESAVAGRIDFLSTALHEIGHVLGLGNSGPYYGFVVDDTFTGPNALLANGGQPIPLEPGGSHIQNGFDGDNTLMDPRSFIGTRQLPTHYDLAMLADIGYEINGYSKVGSLPDIVTLGDDNPVFGTVVADVIDGGAGNDQLQGDRGDDTLIGGTGDDALFGQSGDDILVGGTGADFLYGNSGFDVLEGGAGNDLLSGGAGADIFRYVGSTDADRITDFDFSEDIIEIGASYGFTSVDAVLDAISRPFSNVSRVNLSSGDWIDVFDNSTGSQFSAQNVVLVAPTQVAPFVEGPSSISIAAGQQIALGAQIGISDGNGFGDIDYVRFWDSTPGTDGGTLQIDGNAISSSYVDVSPQELSRISYIAGPNLGSNEIVVEAFDRTGRDSNDLLVTIEVTTTQPLNLPPLTTASGQTVAPGTSVPLNSIFAWSDPDGNGDVLDFSIQDQTLGGGYLTKDGARQFDDTLFSGQAISEIGRWAFVAGADGDSDNLRFSVFDRSGEQSNETIANVNSVASDVPITESLIGPLLPNVLALARDAYMPNGALASDAGWADYNVTGYGLVDLTSVSLVNTNLTFHEAIIGGERTLALAFSGTADVLDLVTQIAAWPAIYESHFLAIEAALNSSAGFERLIVTGHSLGGILTEFLLSDPRLQSFDLVQDSYGVTFGSPGSTDTPPLSARLVNFVNLGDPVAMLNSGDFFGVVSNSSDYALRAAELVGFGLGLSQNAALELFEFVGENLAPVRDGTTISIIQEPYIDWLATGIGRHGKDGVIGYEGSIATLSGAYGSFFEGFEELDYWANEESAWYFNDGQPSAIEFASGLISSTIFSSLEFFAYPIARSIIGFTSSGAPIAEYLSDAAISLSFRAAEGVTKVIANSIEFGGQAAEFIAGVASDLNTQLSEIGDRTFITFFGTEFGANDLTRDEGSAILGIDLDHDGVPEITTSIQGEYELDRFFVIPGVGETTILYSKDTQLIATNKRDILVGNGEADEIRARGGDDIVFASGGKDLISGGSGGDLLFGGAGKDLIKGGKGNDLLWGGLGNDRINGGAGRDTAFFDDSVNGVVVDLKSGRASGNGDDRLKKIENVVGSDQGDFITGNEQRNTLDGQRGNDILKGGRDKDKLLGGAGEDSLFGGGGNDRLFGEAGNDVLKGGGGADRFVFRAGYEQDTITDFSDKHDVLDLRSFGLSSVSEAKSYATMMDGDTVFDFGGGDVLILEDFDVATLDKSDFIL